MVDIFPHFVSNSDMTDKQKWDQRYQTHTQNLNSDVAPVLEKYQYLLPSGGQALDVACGTGANALFLAKLGFDTYAWDVSSVALSQLRQNAEIHDLKIHVEERDVVEQPPEHNRFDVITVFRFLERGLCTHLASALRPEGLLYYQTFTRIKQDSIGPTNPEYLLDRNELLTLFNGLHVVIYHEEELVGDVHQGIRNHALLVAIK